MTSQNVSLPSASSSSYVMKMNETPIQTIDSNEYSSNESLLPRNTELLALSVTNNTQQNPVPTITFNEAEQFTPFETHPDVLNYLKDHHPEQMINSNSSIQQLNASFEGEFSDGQSFDNTDYTFNPEFNSSFTIPKDLETNKTDILHYDEILSDVLLPSNNNISHIQHAPLFGCAVENLFNFPTSGFDLLETNDADNVNLSVTDNHSSGMQVIMGLTQDGHVIVDGLSMPINKKLNIDRQNVSNMFYTMSTGEGIVSLPMSQILEDLDEQHRDVKNVTSNEVVTSLTANGEFIIANTTDNNSRVTKHLVSIIMGLTASGQIICGGCVSDTTPGSVLTLCEKTIESNEHHATLSIIGNLTAKNEKVIIGLADLNFTNVDNGSLFRRDSF